MDENKKIEKVDQEKKGIGVIELPSLDITKNIGKKSFIESTETYKGQYGYFLKVETDVIDTIDTKDGKQDIKASRIFGLFEDKNGNIGWGENTTLGIYLKKMNVNHFNELIGKEVIIQSITNKTDGKDYLSFI